MWPNDSIGLTGHPDGGTSVKLLRWLNAEVTRNLRAIEMVGVLMRIFSFSLVGWLGPSSPFFFVWAFNTTDAVLLSASGGKVLTGSIEENNAGGTQRPVEIVEWKNETNAPETVQLAINRFSGLSPRLKFVLMENGGGEPDIVLLDIRMPEMDGLEAARKIKQRHPKVGVIMLTAYDDRQFVVEAVRSGARGYVLKARDAEHLAQCVCLSALAGPWRADEHNAGHLRNPS